MASEHRATQLSVEVLHAPGGSTRRVTQFLVEVLYNPDNPAPSGPIAPTNPDRINAITKSYNGLLHRTYGFTNVSDADTWDLGEESVTNVAWEASTSADGVLVAFSGQTVTFTVSGTPTERDGRLHVWSHK